LFKNSVTEYDESGFSYRLLADGSGYELSKGKWIEQETLTIPSSFQGLPVKRIADRAFTPVVSGDWRSGYSYNLTIKELILPDTLEEIGIEAFEHLALLEEIIIPDSVTKIEEYARS